MKEGGTENEVRSFLNVIPECRIAFLNELLLIDDICYRILQLYRRALLTRKIKQAFRRLLNDKHALLVSALQGMRDNFVLSLLSVATLQVPRHPGI